MEAIMATETTVKAVILRDFWDDKGERHPAGEVLDVTKDVLIDGLEKNILARVKDEA
jgi:hypothetical protein